MKFLWAVLFSIMLFGVSASAQQHGATPGDKYDTKLPVEISSDSLEVLQHENKAIFKGNVIAVQGQLRLKSDVMTVHYRQKKDEGTKPPEPKPQPAPGTPAAANAMGTISKIDVDGHVFMASPEESAQGDKGDYDVDAKTIHLFGGNVILTRDKNILRGTALEYNLETGRSLLTNGNNVVTGKSDGRVRGVFVPNETKQNETKSR
jgi:lipopolysaccharide export system protein LptA